ncbi:MAG: ribosomal-processing cysteine protease Prp [Synergistaceae bacterium]|nr:ribosomal-processing cysteine protease Prp [Synergistaceae bacterium]
MIALRFFYQDKNLVGIESKGHSGYADRGRDIICAAVSVLMQSLLLGLTEIAKAEKINFSVEKKTPLIKISWPPEVQASEKFSLLIQTIAESLKIIAADNPKHVKIFSEEI